MQRCLERRRPAGDDGGVGARQDLGRPAIDDLDVPRSPEQRPIDGRRDRDDQLQTPTACLEAPRRLQHRRPDTPDLLGAGAGEKRKHAVEGALRNGRPQPVGQRVPDVDGGYVMRLVETGLERQDDQHARDVARDLPDPSGSPCPDARADEVCDGNAVHPQASRQAQIEVRAVD